jgi:hypothetical protein
MRDTTLYQHLLGLMEPWTVAKVDLDVASQRVDVWVEHPKGCSGPARTAEHWPPCTITPPRVFGAIWTVASSRRFCTPSRLV